MIVRYCDYETKAFECCKRAATKHIDRNGCYCTQHAQKILTSLRRDDKERFVEKIKGTE